MKRDEMAHDGEKNRFRYQCERMIEQFTITNPGDRCLLFTSQCHIKQHAKGGNILESNFEACTEIERDRAGALCRANAS
jgi:hypothetical protein